MRGLRDAGLCTNVARLMTFARSSLRRIVGVGVLVLGTAAVAAMTGAGCDDTTDGTGGSADCLDAKGCFDYTCYKPGATRSFKTDVLPIFEQSCSLSSSCHGNPKSPMTAEGYQMYLGEVDPTPATPSDVAKILSLIVSQPSPSAMGELIVDPGKPETSWLMQKMDGDVDCGAVTCKFSDCGKSMPQGVKPLPQATRDIVRDWIKQGALDN